MKKSSFGFILLAAVMLSIFIFLPIAKGAGEGRIVITNSIFFIAVLGPLSALILWIWMFLDFFSHKGELKHKILWGLMLFFANWIASIIYFLIIYYPREKRSLGKHGGRW